MPVYDTTGYKYDTWGGKCGALTNWWGITSDYQCNPNGKWPCCSMKSPFWGWCGSTDDHCSKDSNSTDYRLIAPKVSSELHI